jgi:hypothetical protein
MVSSYKMVGDTASIGTPAGLGYRAEVWFGQTTLSWTRIVIKRRAPAAHVDRGYEPLLKKEGA